MLFLLAQIDWAGKGIDLIGDIITAVIIAVILQRAFLKQREIGKNLTSEGIEKVSLGNNGRS